MADGPLADGGLRQFISYLINLVLCDNGSASNTISAQIFKTLDSIMDKHLIEINDKKKQMKKTNKLEVIGVALMAIGGLFWLSEKYYILEELNSFYSWARIILYSGLAIWAFGLMQKEAEKRKQKEMNKTNLK